MPRRTLLAVLAAALALPPAAQAHDLSAGSRVAARAAASAPEPPITPTPRATCNPGSKPEPGIQGRVPKEEVDAGRADEGYWCNVTRIGHVGATGGFRVHRYVDKAGRECAYYDTALLFPTNALNLSLDPTGVAVLDMSDPRNPVRTETLVTPAMQTPHESLNLSVQRGILAAVMGNPYRYPGGVDLYDVSEDCRHPVPMAAAFPATPFGHESGMAPDGLTFYPSSAAEFSAVDILNPRVPRTLWTSEELTTHGLSISDDGRRAYLASIGNGLVIVDTSEIQDRRPNAQGREVSRLTWSNITIPQIPIPVTIGGRPYVVEVDEYSTDENGDIGGHGDRVGAARIIDVSDERNPFVVSNLRLEVHQKENRAAIGGDYGAQSPVQGYAAHYCNVPRREDPGIVACSMILSGLRVFDIRDPQNPREIAYHVAPPSHVSETGATFIDERANWAMSQPAFAPERGEIWYSDGTSGFYALKVDEDVWPFRDGGGGVDASPSGRVARCVDTGALASASAQPSGGGLRLRFRRRARLPVQVDVFRVSRGRRVITERLVARFRNAREAFTWRARVGPGLYFVRFRMIRGGRSFDTRRIVLQRTRAGRFRLRPRHHQRESCGLLRLAKLERPAFGGRRGTPLRGAYRLTAPATVTVTVRRGARVVRRFAASRPANRVFRFGVAARGLARGDYRVVIHAAAGEDQAAAVLTARRL
ncbi:MAG TPA: hypothetical protein VGW75_00060 [Solirubrobacteraceae bacterium]|jgi:hypothetical protein|nr:hypothetical protein [Solirubrobacteraceae bacterium]